MTRLKLQSMIFLLCALSLPFCVQAQRVNLSGNWEATIRAKTVTYTVDLNLNQKDNSLTGISKRRGNYPTNAFTGTVIGDSVFFSFTVQAENGRDLNVQFMAKHSLNKLEGTQIFTWQDTGETLGQPRIFTAKRTAETAKPKAFDNLPLIERVQQILDRHREQQRFPGATAAYSLPDGRPAVFATGYADQEARIPMTKETSMLAGSVGKTFVAALAVKLAQMGKLGLDDKIEKWLGNEPWFSRLPNGKDITLRNLLSHRGGLVDHVKTEAFAQAIGEKLSAENADSDFYFKPVEMIEFVLDREPLFPAGEGFNYTDTGYLLVGLIIEKAGNDTYYSLLQNHLLEPLGLHRTVPADKRELSGLCPGYLNPQNPLGLPENTFADGKMTLNPLTEWTGGGLVSNVQDLVMWAKLLYEEKALPAPYLAELFQPVPPDAEQGYGLGVTVRRTMLGKTYGHSG